MIIKHHSETPTAWARKKSKLDKYCLTHSTFFEETFQMPSLGVAFLKESVAAKVADAT